ncbi:hypothetical protein P7C73_g5870, partial [Tremellales sp. Uapishka_1]
VDKPPSSPLPITTSPPPPAPSVRHASNQAIAVTSTPALGPPAIPSTIPVSTSLDVGSGRGPESSSATPRDLSPKPPGPPGISATAPTQASAAPASINKTPSVIPPSQRGPYVQPKLVKVVDEAPPLPPDPIRLKVHGYTREIKRPLALPVRPLPTTQAGPSNLPSQTTQAGPSRQQNFVPRTNAAPSVRPASIVSSSNATPIGSAGIRHPPDAPGTTQLPPPTGPRNDPRPPRPLIHPQGFRPPIQPQRSSFLADDERRGGLPSPLAPGGGTSPMVAAPAVPPNSGLSPAWPINVPAHPGPSSKVGMDPRLRAKAVVRPNSSQFASSQTQVFPVESPIHPSLSPIHPSHSPMHPSHPLVQTSPLIAHLSPPHMSPTEPAGGFQPTSHVSPKVPVSLMLTIRSRFSSCAAGVPDHLFDMMLFRGSPLAPECPHSFLKTLLPWTSQPPLLAFRETYLSSVRAAMAEEARVREWLKLSASTVNGVEARDEWYAFKRSVSLGNRAFACYLEPPHGESIDCHYALVVANAASIDLQGTSLGSWLLPDIGLAMFVLALPLTSGASQSLFNPINPRSTMSIARGPQVQYGMQTLLESYGLPQAFFNTLRNKSVMVYPGNDGREGIVDPLHDAFITQLKRAGVKPYSPSASIDICVLFNSGMSKIVKSSVIREQVVKANTLIYAVGTCLSLLPSEWTLTPVWSLGGLVTFSPGLIMNEPAKLFEIMTLIRMRSHWDAYITPPVLRWCELAMTDSLHCPDPTNAYSALVNSLNINRAITEMSGNAASSEGGLAVTCCPPYSLQQEACTRWITWMNSLSMANDFQSLLRKAQTTSTETFTQGHAGGADVMDIDPPTSLDLGDVERAQMKDMTAMRMRPHLLPYRRYLYVGRTSLEATSESATHGAALELISPDEIIRLLINDF